MRFGIEGCGDWKNTRRGNFDAFARIESGNSTALTNDANSVLLLRNNRPRLEATGWVVSIALECHEPVISDHYTIALV
jgi:hypothetical protein